MNAGTNFFPYDTVQATIHEGTVLQNSSNICKFLPCLHRRIKIPIEALIYLARKGIVILHVDGNDQDSSEYPEPG